MAASSVSAISASESLGDRGHLERPCRLALGVAWHREDRYANGGRRGIPDDAERTPPWLDELDYRVLRVDTAGANPYIETCFYHRESRSLLVTDLVLSIPTFPPEDISRNRLLNLAPDDPGRARGADG